MDLNQFISNFADQFDETDKSVFKADTKFHDVDEYSSMIGLALIAMVDSSYGKKITGEEIRKSQTIEDLFNVVNAK